MIVALGDARFEVEPGWGQLPAGWNFPDAAGVAVGPDDSVHVFNRGQRPTSPDHPVIVFDADGRFVRAFGDGIFRMPHAITVDAAGISYCVDSFDHTVRIFDAGGRLVRTLGTVDQPSDTGYVHDYRDVMRGGPPFNKPTKVAIDSNGDILAADGYGNARIHRFRPDGELVGSWGEPGRGPGQFNLVHSVVVAPDGRLLVCDRENYRIQAFEKDGVIVDEWPGLIRPNDLVVDQDGIVFVIEQGERSGLFPFMARPWGHDRPARLSALTLDGRVVGRSGGEDHYSPDSFFAPHGIAINSRGDLFVAEVVSAGGATRDQIDDLRKPALTKFRRLA